MAVVTLVNTLKSHLHIASINKVVSPLGRLHLDSSSFESNPELVGCVSRGILKRADDGPKEASAPAQEPPVDDRCTVMTEKGPSQASPSKTPEAPQAAGAAKRTEPDEPPKDERSTVWTPDGPAIRRPFKMPEAQQSRRAGDEKAETINGVEVLNLSGSVRTETVEGVEIETPQEDALGDQFIENNPERSKAL